MTRRPKVLMAMSGGVDSSVGAALLQQQGYDVVGVFMRLGSPGESLDELTPGDVACAVPGSGGEGGGAGVGGKIHHQGCCSIGDAADARGVAAQLGIPFYVANFKKDFGRIMDYFAAEYASGRTPNPCVRCNDWLKFGKLHEYAAQIDAEFVASGHYARVEGEGDRRRLMRGVDHAKDQSYVLFGMPREKLARTLLPIGGLEKGRVRAIARELGLAVFDKPDSQEICFVPDNDYAGFVERRLGGGAAGAGAVLDLEGREVGRHSGHHRFTIGQRRGVGVALGYPIFVVSKDPIANTVTVGPRERLMVVGCVAGEANWLTPDPPQEWTRVLVKHRSNSAPVRGEARALSAEIDVGPSPSGRSGIFEVRFDEPQEAVTPGQAVVLYDGAEPEVVLGGGWIGRAVGAHGAGA
jgi:tRNA-specific 2-thiouridylase